MKIEQIIGKLATKGNLESHPEPDVADKVIETLYRKSKMSSFQETPLVWIAALSSAMAILMVFVSYTSFQYMSNPINAIFWEIPWRLL
jgi:hypothetical protein